MHMDALLSFYERCLQFAGISMRATVIFVLAALVIYGIERFLGDPTQQYRTRAFWHQTLWYFLGYTGLKQFLFLTWLFVALEKSCAFLDLRLCEFLPIVPRYIVIWIVTDFVAYWVHRMRHAIPWMWAFHITHHAAQHLTLGARDQVHPAENVWGGTIMFVTALMLGASPQALWWFYYLRLFSEFLQHTEVRWRFGPLYYVVVSPAFHAGHHSIQPEHYDKNFGLHFSCWDFLFGTALDLPERPRKYGVEHVPMPTLYAQFCDPFRLLWDYYRGQARARQILTGKS